MQEALTELRRKDPILAHVMDQVGPYAIRYLEPGFATLAKAIVYQQLSGKVAAQIYDRLLQIVGDGGLSPSSLLRVHPSRLRRIGLSKQKIGFLRQLAREQLAGRLRLEQIETLPDEEALRALTCLRGVGLWTAHMYLIFALRRQDILPSTDLGIRKAIQKVYGLKSLPSPPEVDRLGERWRPFRTVASWYLWRSQEPDANL